MTEINLPSLYSLDTNPVIEESTVELHTKIDRIPFSPGKMLGGFVNGLVAISLVISCCHGDDECQEVVVPMCRGLVGYTHTRLPNRFGHVTQSEVYRAIERYWPFMDSDCHKNFRLTVCGTFLPKCSTGSTATVLPCRETCFSAKRGCSQKWNREEQNGRTDSLNVIASDERGRALALKQCLTTWRRRLCATPTVNKIRSVHALISLFRFEHYQTCFFRVTNELFNWKWISTKPCYNRVVMTT